MKDSDYVKHLLWYHVCLTTVWVCDARCSFVLGLLGVAVWVVYEEGCIGITSNSTFNGIGSLNMDSTGQFASVLLQDASNSSFLAFAETVVLMVTPLSMGESGGFSASATASTLTSSILLCLQTSANIVTAQSAKAIMANSNAVGPVSSPP